MKEDLKEAVKKDRAERVEKCSAELNKAMDLVLKKYNCALDVTMVLKKGSVEPLIGVMTLAEG